MERRTVPLLVRAASELLEAESERDVVATAMRILGDHHGYGPRYLLLSEDGDLVMAAAQGSGTKAAQGYRAPLGTGLAGACAQQQRVINCPDVTTDKRYVPLNPETRSEIVIPLIARSDLLGVLAVDSPRLRAFGTEDEETLSAFAKLVALALMHARTDELRRREVDELQAMSTVARRATLDLDGTAQAVVEEFSRVTTSDSVVVYLLDRTTGCLVPATVAYDHALYPDDYRSRLRPLGVGEGLSGWAAKTRQAALVPDVSEDERALPVTGVPLDAKAGIVVPLVVENELLGVIRAVKMGAGSFTDDHFRLAKALGAQASLAIAAARAHQEQGERLQELAVLKDISSRLSEVTTLHQVLSSALDGAVRITGGEAGIVWRRHDDGLFRLAVSHNLDAERLAHHAPNDPGSASSEMARTGQAMRIDDLREDPRVTVVRAAPHLRSAIGVPLRSEGRVYGALWVLHSSPGFFSERHEGQVQVVAAHCGAALARAEAFEEATRLSITDELTGFFNARYFHARLGEEIARAQRYGHELALVLVDSDALKNVNDRLGHEAGNEHLRRVARTIRESVRATDIVARYGGDEFVILQPEAGIDAARMTAERIRAAAAEALGDVATSVSVGVAAYPNVKDADALFREADRALGEAKRRGKNTVVVAG
ncbi:MAG TPA: GAF domain-containing protein [Candidatus Limnocylindria bacterium]|nr:GAF domain-containing protein [Candidatus Limnocylindria bacterium]